MQKDISREISKLTTYYLNNKKQVVKGAFLTILFLLLAMAVNGFKLLYPYQFLLSIPFLVLSVRYFLSIFLFNSNKITQSILFKQSKYLVIKYEKILFITVFALILLYISSQVIPNDNNPFASLKKEEIKMYVDDSVQVSAILLDNIESSGNDLLDSGLLQKENLTVDEVILLDKKWNQFLQAALDSENMTDVHRYFAKISLFTMPETHMKSFVISYSLYMKKFEFFEKIISMAGNNERVIKVLNEYSPVFGDKNSYFDVRDRHVSHETLLRRNLGRAYLYFLNSIIDDKNFGEEYKILTRESYESYSYIIKNLPSTVSTFAIDTKGDIESTLFAGWFPIQKNVANTLGTILVSTRKETFITVEQIQTMKPSLQPGDIFVQRRNWHASNVGIPGFWPHAALYIGTLSDANDFFKDVFPFDGYIQFSDLVKAKYPVLYEKYNTKDENGYNYAVIEGQAPGIILQSLEKSAKADYLGVLRPRLDKKDTLLALLRSFENYGKPYDYNFDFETRDELVCSELVYDAYVSKNDKKGLTFELTVTAGRKMISPNDIVEKFFKEKGTPNQELDFVYFIDGNESLKSAFVKDEIAFSTSWTRPKFSKLQE